MLVTSEILNAAKQRAAAINVERLRVEMRNKRPIDANSPERLKEWVQSAGEERARAEGVGLERILGGNDLMNINYLDRGLLAAKSVGRVVIRDSSGTVRGYGTGFLISPRLLLTNNHVLRTAESARASSVQFNYQYDVDGVKTVADEFSLVPDECYITSTDLDYTVVAVKPTSDSGNVSLSKYGYLKLNPVPGKTLDAQYLTIIQHPSGERKQVALRENQLIKTLDKFLWYATDTNPGASGSCVFNDSWQVVALHHAGVPATNAAGQYLSIDGTVWTDSMGEEKLKWIANEGVRVSAIVSALEAFTAVPLVKQLLDSLAAKKTESTVVYPSAMDATPATILMTAERISIDPNYDNRHGYDPAFLGTGGKRVPLPRLSSSLLLIAAKKKEDDTHAPHVLTYHHYSAVINAERKLAFYTAVNIDGGLSRKLKRESDRWIFDPRIDENAQAGEELYANNDFDRGHLVRRLDPAWGDLAKVANDDTFHFTNCSPQHKDFNQSTLLWQGLENYILDNSDANDLKVTVFNGPAFRNDDTEYRGVKIPEQYWKVVAMVRANGKLSATAYLVSQAKLITDILEEEFVFGKYRTFQVPIKRIESLTGLNFGKLRDYDPLATSATDEATAPLRALGSYGEIVL